MKSIRQKRINIVLGTKMELWAESHEQLSIVLNTQAERRVSRSGQNALWTEHKALWTEHKALSTEQKALWTEQKALWTEHKALWTEQKAFWTEHKAL